MKPFHQGLVKQLVMAGFAKPCAEQYVAVIDSVIREQYTLHIFII